MGGSTHVLVADAGYRVHMSSITEHLSRWVRAGVLDEEAAARIRAYEAAQVRARSPEDLGERPGIVEAIVYLGLVVVSVGAMVLIGTNWDQLESWARIAVIAAATLVTLVLGAALRHMDDAPLQRGGQAAWLVSVALFAGLLAVAINETFGITSGDERGAFLFIAVAALVYAIVLWIFEPSYPQILAVGGASFFLAQAAGTWPDEFSPEVVTIAGVSISALALTLGELGKLPPRTGTRAIFGLLALFTSFMSSFETSIGWEMALFVVAGALIVTGVWRNSFTLLVLGVLGAFGALVTFMFAHFSNELGAPLALIISGGMLLVTAVVTVQARKVMQRGRS